MTLSPITLLLIFGSILISMTLHEAMHAFTSHWLGDDTAKAQGRLSLNPLVHIDLFTTILLPLMLVLVGLPPFGAAKPVPFNPYKIKFGEWGSALVSLAGPLTNLVLALLGGIILRNFGDPFGFLQIFILVNTSFFVFNMIPFPPLDGSRLLYAISPDWFRILMERVESMGFSAIILFMIVFYTFLAGLFVNIQASLFRLIVG